MLFIMKHLNTKKYNSNKFKFLFIIILFIIYVCHTKVILPESTVSKQQYQKPHFSNYLEVSNIKFEQEIIDVSSRYNYGDGYFYEFDFKNHKNKWQSVEHEMDILLQYQFSFVEIWYNGGSSICTPP